MKPTKSTLDDFLHLLPRRLKRERELIIRGASGEWDARVRRNFADVLCKWFCQDFKISPEEVRQYVYVEGWNSIPDKARGGAFFGTKVVYPDAALILSDQFSVAIELDHGTKGSEIKNALAKASFSVTLGGFDRALVLFFVDTPKSTADFREGKVEKNILELYRTYFGTTLHIL